MKTNVAKGLRLTPQLLKPSDEEAADGGLLFPRQLPSSSRIQMSKRAGERTSLPLSARREYGRDNGSDDDALRRQTVFKHVEALAGSQTFRYFFFALSRLPSTSLSALPSEAECRCISRPPGVVAPLALENLLLLP